jgi:hypothetical protein
MKEVKKKTYQAPKLTTVSFKAERGYVSSGEFLFGAFVPEEQTIESRSNTGGYFGDGGSGDESTWF